MLLLAVKEGWEEVAQSTAGTDAEADGEAGAGIVSWCMLAFRLNEGIVYRFGGL